MRFISYSGLEPVSDNLSATDRVFTFTGGSETITLFDILGGPAMAIDSTLGEVVTFNSPTNSLTIDAGTGNDTININGVDIVSFTASLVIHGGTGDDTVNLNTDITFTANRNLDVDLQNDDPTPGTDQIAVAANANYLLSGTGSALLAASRGISLASASSIVTVDGALTLAANQQATPTTGAGFIGVDVNGATVQSTGSAMVQVLGKGGTVGSNNHGVRVAGVAVIQSGTGPLQVMGVGGGSTSSPNPGVTVEGLGALH